MNLKNISLRLIQSSKRLLEAIEKKLTPSIQNEQMELLFEDLAPIDDSKESEIYISALNWALKNEKVTNIALTGPYGSGKSSIIKTFEKRYCEYKCLNISLATFKDNDFADSSLPIAELPELEKPKSTNTKDENHRLIELSILQQMFYHETEEKIPNSRFKRISEISNKTLIGNITMICLWLWGIALLWNSETMPRFTWWSEFYHTYCNWIILFALILMAPGSFYVIQSIVKQFSKISFSKLNIKSGEIEFNPKSETSILNKHLDEILYFFQVTDYSVVVIEDLDRFKDPEIFTKLRELNYLLNNSLQVNRRIVFVYAIKDDIFKDESRTKFFDFIIPVMPVINSNNSFEKLNDKLKLLAPEIKFRSDFVNDITLYIDDMRALKNIFNEYLIYKDLLKRIPFKHEKLLAIIIYKNIHPTDFAELHHNKGILYNVFAKKPHISNKLTVDNESLLLELGKTLQDTNDSFIKKVKELRAIYIENIVGRLPGFQSFSFETGAVNLEAAKSDANFEELRQSTTIYYNSYNPSYGQNRRTTSGFSFKEVENAIDKNKTYIEREQIVKNASKTGIARLQKQISDVKKNINDIRLMTLKELFDFDPGIISEFDAEFKKDKLLIYLIRDGWIDETYPSLTSHFYEGSISVNDMAFIMHVKNRESAKFEYSIEKADSALSRLKLEDFKREAVLNYKLLDYLVSDQSQNHHDKIHLINEQIILDKSKARDFFLTYLNQGSFSHAYLAIIAKEWPQMWDDLNSKNALDNTIKAQLAKMLLKHCDIQTIKAQNTSKNLQNFIETQSDFLAWFGSEDEKKVEQVIKSLELQFESLKVEEANSKLFEFIYLNDYYAINPHMIFEVFRVKGGTQFLEKLTTANYTMILASPFKELINIIESNIEIYIRDVFLKLPNNNHESEESLIALLNQEEAINYVSDIMSQQEAEISDLKSVRNDTWKSLINEKRVSPTWQNVLNYYNENAEIDETLTAFLNEEIKYSELAKTRFNSGSNFEKDIYSKFSKAFLVANISNEAFAKILSNYPFYYDKPSSIAFENLSEEKIKILLSNRILRLGPETYTLISDHFIQLRSLLIENNTTVFFENRPSYELRNSDYLALLRSSRLSKEQKVVLIKELTPEVIETTKGFGTFLSQLLVEYKYIGLSYDILLSILTTSTASSDNVILAYWHIGPLAKDAITTILQALGEPYSKITVPKKQPKIPDTEINRLLGKELQSIGYIRKAKEEKGNLRFYNK